MLWVGIAEFLRTVKAPEVLLLSVLEPLGLLLVAGDAYRIPAKAAAETGDFVAVTNIGEDNYLEAIDS